MTRMTRGKSKSTGKTRGFGSVLELENQNRLVCPICGAVWEDGTAIGFATSMEAYIQQGYDPKACPDCVAAGRTVGFSGEFDFDEDGI